MRTTHALALVLLVASSAALAQSPWYAGAAAGVSIIQFDDDILPITGAPGTTLTKDEDGTSFKVFGGYRIIRNLAIEAGYQDLGKFSAKRSVTGDPASSVSANFKSSGAFLDVRGIFPLRGGRWDLYGKAGVMRTMTKADFSASGGVVLNPAIDRSPTASEWNVRLGLGAELRLDDKVSLRADLERVLDVGKHDTTGEGDVDVVSIGLTFRF